MPTLSVLKRAQIEREIFNPENEAHLASMKTFLKTGNWGDVQFFAELPYIEVPMTVMRKYCEHNLKVTREVEVDRIARFKQMNLTKVSGTETSEQKNVRHALTKSLVEQNA